jgi:hypothetical protein
VTKPVFDYCWACDKHFFRIDGHDCHYLVRLQHEFDRIFHDKHSTPWYADYTEVE